MRALRWRWTRQGAAALGELARDRDVQIASGLGLLTLLLLALTATQGFVRDEGYYFRAARDYHTWFERLGDNLGAGEPVASFADDELRRAFGYNTEHPGFAKILMGWTWKIFHHWLGLVSNATGFRLASMLLTALASVFTFLLGARLFSRRVGLLAVALLMACPHVFYHAHLACFDGPIMGLTVAVVYGFYRSLASRGWILAVGVLGGVAVATKHNAVFLFPTLLLAYAGAHAWEIRRDGRGAIKLPGLPLGFLTIALCAPVIFYLFYPYGWHDPLARIGDYYTYHLHHEHYPVDYLGVLLTEPPFPLHFPFVFSALSIPVPILFAGTLGILLGGARAAASLRRREPARDRIGWWLLVTNALVPPLIIAVPSVPIFGGTKHWMTMMPFFCLLAAWVVGEAATLGRERWSRLGQVLAPGIVGLVLLLPAIETARTHPFGHTYFNELAGGHAGGAALGMPRTFWGGDGRALLEVLNEQAEHKARVFTDRMNFDDFSAYKKDGLLRQDLRWTREPRQAGWAIINHQREYWDNELRVWSQAGDTRPVAVVAFDDVSIASLYRVQSTSVRQRPFPKERPPLAPRAPARP